MSDESTVDITGDASGLLSAFGQAESGADKFSDHMVSKMAEVVGVVFSVEKAFEGLKESIAKSTEIRDLAASLTVFTGSVGNATKAMAFFEEAAKNTRNTSEELAFAFRDMLPQAIARGFSQDTLQQATGWLSQLSTISGNTLAEMESGFQQLLSGRVTSRNPLLKVLGITKADIKDLGWDQILEKMQEISGHFPEFGQSFESTLHKMKEDILKFIGEGINAATGGGQGLVKALSDSLESPAAIETWHSIGDFIGNAIQGNLLLAISNGKIEKALEETTHPSTWFTLDPNKGVFNSMANWLQGASNTPDAAQSASLAAMSAQNRGQMAIAPSSSYGANNPYLGYGPGGSGSEVTGVTGGPASVTALYENLGNVLAAHKDKAAAIIEAIRDETHDGVISWTDYTSSVAWALTQTDEMTKKTDPLQKGLGKVAQAAKTAGDAWADLARVMGGVVLLGDKINAAFVNSNPSLMAGSGTYGDLTPDGYTNANKGPNGYEAFNDPFGQNLPSSNNKSFDLTGYDQGMSTGLTDAYTKAANAGAEAFGVKMHDQFIGTFSSDIANAFSQGGKHFVQAMAKDFKGTLDDGAKSMLEVLFGKKTKDPVTGVESITGGLFGGDGSNLTNLLHPKAPNAMATAGTLVGAGISAYEAGKQAPSNAIGMGALQGFVGGLASGNIYVAIAAAVVGAIAGGVGAAQTRKDYLYSDVQFDKQGGVKLVNEQNIQPAQQQQMISDVESTVDQYRNSYTRLLQKMGIDGSPFDGSKLNVTNATTAGGSMSGPTGVIQDNPSAHFMEHFQQWLAQTLPREVAGQFKSELQGGFGTVGLDATQFDSMWKKYDGLDPAKVAGMLSALFDALKQIQDATTQFGKPSSVRLAELQVTQQQTFAQALAVSDGDITKFAAGIKDLVGEDQITAAGQLGTMMTARNDAEKAFLQSLLDILKSAKQASDALNQSLDVRLLHNADGSPDNAALAAYYKKDADAALRGVVGATNPQDAQTQWNRFLADLDQVSQKGYAIDTATGDAYTKWAQDQIAGNQGVFTAAITKFGTDMASQDALFLKAINPSIDAFKNSIGGSNVVVGQFGTALGDTTTAAQGLTTSFNALGGAVDQLNKALAAAKFASSTVAARQAS